MKWYPWVRRSITRVCSLICILSFTCFADPYANDSQNKANTQLNDIKSAISNTRTDIKKVSKKRKALEIQLKKDDLAISANTRNINKNKVKQSKIKKELSALATKKKVLIKDKKFQEDILAKQLRSAYSSGHHDYIKLLLNQEDPASIQRTLTHYQYVNDARIKEIKRFRQTIKELANIEKMQKQQSAALTDVLQRLTQDKKSLDNNKKNRATTIASLKKEQLNKEQQLEQLLADEKNLKVALDRLAKKVIPKKNLTGLAKLKRKLSWPVSGKIRHRFGTQKHGYIKWKGVLKSAPIGAQVKVIHNGTVLFSDWLKGYGLITIIDHGKGYMSLYGHNQTLLKKVGDYVEQGETISLVGQSGGQLQPGLYFEIRHVGKAVNPKLWCR